MAEHDLLIRIEAATALLRRQLADADAAVAGTERKVNRAVGNMNQAWNSANGAVTRLTGALGSLGVALSVGAMVAFTQRTLDAAGGLGELADQLGVTVEMLQVYQFAAGQAGIKQEEMNASLARLTRTIGDAVAGEKQAVASFRRYGVSFQDVSGNARTTDAVIRDVADRIAGMKSPAEQGAAAYELFGRAGQKLLPLLKGGSAAIDDQVRAAKAAGAVVQDDMVGAADAAADSITKMTNAIDKAAQQVVARFAPAITAAAEWVTENLDEIGRAAQAVGVGLAAMASTVVIGNLTAIGAALKTATAAAWGFAAAIRANPLGAMVGVIGLVATALSYFRDETLKVGDATVRVGSLVEAIWKTVWGTITGVVGVVGSLARALFNLVTLDFGEAGEVVKRMAQDMREGRQALADAWGNLNPAPIKEAADSTLQLKQSSDGLASPWAQTKDEIAKATEEAAKFAEELRLAADARQRLAEAAGLGEAAQRSAQAQNAVAAAYSESPEKGAAVARDEALKEAQERLRITNETVRGLEQETAANERMAVAVMQGSEAVRMAERAEYEAAITRKLGADAVHEIGKAMEAYDRQQASSLKLTQARILADQQLQARETLSVNAVRVSTIGQNEYDRERAMRSQERLNEATKQFGETTSEAKEQWLRTQAAIDESEISTQQLEDRFSASKDAAGDLGNLFDNIASGSMDNILNAMDQFSKSMEDVLDTGGSLGDTFEAMGKAMLESAQAGNGLANMVGKLTGRSEAQNRNANIGGQIGGTVAKSLGLPKGVGAFLGNLFGGLFGPGRSVGPISNASVGWTGRGERIDVIGSAQDNNGDRQGASRAGRLAIATVDQIMEDFGGRFEGLMNQFQIGENRQGFFVSRSSFDGLNNLSADDVTRLGTIEDAVAVAVQRMIDGTYGLVSGVSDRMRSVLAQTQGRPLDQLLEELERLKAFEDFVDVSEPLTQVGEAVKELGKQAEDAAKFAREYGLSVDEVTAAQGRAMQRLRDDFNDSVRADIFEATGRGYLNQVGDLRAQRDERRRDAATLGVGTGDVEAAFVLQVQRVIDSTQLTGAAFEELVSAFPELRDQVHAFTAATEAAARSAADILQERTGLEAQLLELQGNTAELRRREREALDASNRALYDQVQALRAQQEQIEAANQAIRSVDDFLGGLRVSIRDYLNAQAVSDSSTLDPTARQARALSDFQAQLARARGGDRDALESITGYADRLLETTTALEGNGTLKAQMEQLVRTSLSGLPDQVNVQQLILSELQRQGTVVPTALTSGNATLATIFQAVNGGTASVTGAIGTQTSALAARLAVLSADINNSGDVDLSEFTAYFTTNGDQLDALAQALGLSNSNLGNIFRELDVNGDGTISHLEAVRNVTANLGGTGSNSTLAAIGQLLYGGNVDRWNGINILKSTLDANNILTANADSFQQRMWADQWPRLDIANTYLGKIAWNTAQTAQRLGGAPAYAVGTDNHPGGMAYVHKDEFMYLPPRTQVFTRAETARMMTGGGAANDSGRVIAALSQQTGVLAAGLAEVCSKVDGLSRDMEMDRQRRAVSGR